MPLTLEQAERWLHDNMNAPTAEWSEQIVADVQSGIPHIYPENPPMWGPEEYADWSHEDLVWRCVFLQCCVRRMGKELRGE